MSSVLVLGAGKSAGYLLDYLLDWCGKVGFELHIADLNTEHLQSLDSAFSFVHLHTAKLDDPEVLRSLIAGKQLVVSMLPAFMHPVVARICVEQKSHLATASYESPEMRALTGDVLQNGLLFLNECGLDPGLDHMSAMRIIHTLQSEGEQITAFHSYCGGLVAEACLADNPWKYKFSWNPRNVVLAGQSTARYLENGQIKLKPYHRLFAESTRHVINNTIYDGYPNRDSLSYRETYGLTQVETLVRGTLRHAGYCSAWNFLLQLGLTDDSVQFPVKPGMTYRDFVEAFLPSSNESTESKLQKVSGFSEENLQKLQWLGLLKQDLIDSKGGSPAGILQALLEKRWELMPDDRDLVVMQHIIESVDSNGKKRICYSDLQVEGTDNRRTAMAKTVGLPLAIGVRMILENKVKQPGLHIPISQEWYTEILTELEEKHQIGFSERTV